MSDQSAIDDALDRAISLHSLGQLEEAEALYRGMLQALPAHPDALNLLGVICQQSGRLAEAIELLTLAIKADPQAAEFYYNLGEALRADRQFEEAAVHLKRAIELHGADAPALKSLAEVYMLLKDEHPAIDCYLKAAKLDPGDGRSRFNAAVAYRRIGKVDEAVLNLEEAVDADPLLAEAYQLLSRIYVEQKNDESALASARRLIKNVPTAESYAFLAAIFSAANLYDDAIDAAHQSVRLDPDCVEGHYQLGRAFDAIGEKRGAALAFGRAGELKPDAYPPYLKLGLAQLAIGEVDRAAETFAAGTRLSEDAVDCWYNLAVAYERLGKVKQGIEAIEKALEIKPDWPPALVVLAIIESKRGRHSVAAPLFEKAWSWHRISAAHGVTRLRFMLSAANQSKRSTHCDGRLSFDQPIIRLITCSVFFPMATRD